MSKGTGIFKMASAMSALTGAFQGAAIAAKAFAKAVTAKIGRGDWHERVKGRNRKRRRYGGSNPGSTRFARKSAQHGSGYAPGKLFKGHRI